MSYASIEEAMLYGYGIERSFCCHVHQEKNASASINSVSGLWFCYACGAKGKYNVAEIPPDKQATQLLRYLKTIGFKDPVYPDGWLYLYDSMGPGDYWLSRFSPKICAVHRLGKDPEGRFATIPVRNEAGEVLGVIRRDLTGEDPAKYRYPPGVKISEHLYNLPRCKGDVLILTEGATDAIAADEAGWTDAVATYRNGISRAQLRILQRYQPKVLLVAYDQDHAGAQGHSQVKYLASHMLSARVDRLTWDTYKDLASIPLSERTDMMKKLKTRYDLD